MNIPREKMAFCQCKHLSHEQKVASVIAVHSPPNSLDVLPSTILRFQIVPLFEDSCKHQDLGVYVSPPHCIEPERLIKTRIAWSRALVFGTEIAAPSGSMVKSGLDGFLDHGHVLIGSQKNTNPQQKLFTIHYSDERCTEQELIWRPSNILNLSSDSNLSLGLPHRLPPCLLHCHCSSLCPPAHGTSILLVEFSAHTMAEKELHDREKLFLEFLK